MIASWIFNRMIRSAFDLWSQDEFDVDAAVARVTDDFVFDGPSDDIRAAETIKGKKANADWLRRWQKEYPKRKFHVKNICYSAWPLCPTNVCIVDWTFTQRNTEGTEYKYDGVSVFHFRNFKAVHTSDYISFKGLLQLSTLIKPTAKA